MGLFDKLFGKKQPEPVHTEEPKPETSGSYLDEIRKITERLEEIQRDMTEENQSQYKDEITALLQREVELLEGQFPGKDG